MRPGFSVYASPSPAAAATRRAVSQSPCLAPRLHHAPANELASYTGLDEEYVRNVINHAEEYVRGNVHTNGMENFWSLLKRAIRGTYVSVEPFHLFRYLDEQAFRYNNRGSKDAPVNDGDRFEMLASHVIGKRLTYAEATGKCEN